MLGCIGLAPSDDAMTPEDRFWLDAAAEVQRERRDGEDTDTDEASANGEEL